MAETNPFHEELEKFTFFYDAFVPERYNWGLVLMARKLAVCMLSQIAQPLAGAAFYCLVLFVACSLQLTFRPYKSDTTAKATDVQNDVHGSSNSKSTTLGTAGMRVKLSNTGSVSINLQVSVACVCDGSVSNETTHFCHSFCATTTCSRLPSWSCLLSSCNRARFLQLGNSMTTLRVVWYWLSSLSVW